MRIIYFYRRSTMSRSYFTIFTIFLCVSGTYQELEKLKQVPPRSYPYLVSVASHEWCHGVLITKNYVLTNARCVYRSNNITIYLGWYSYPEDQKPVNESDIQIYKPIKVITHPQYGEIKKYWMYRNDIGLLKLPQAVSVTAGVRPARLPDPNEFNISNLTGLYGTVFGWWPARYVSAAKVEIRSHEQCIDVFGRAYLKDRNFCVNWPPGPRLCSHHSLPMEVNGKLIGLQIDDTQNEVECTLFEYKFLNIAFYYDWIMANSDLGEYIIKPKENAVVSTTVASSFSLKEKDHPEPMKRKCKIDIELECPTEKEYF